MSIGGGESVIQMVLSSRSGVADKTEHLCPSRDFARQASAQIMCVSSEWSSLVSFDAVFVDIFPLCNLTYLSLDYRPYYDVFLIPF